MFAIIYLTPHILDKVRVNPSAPPMKNLKFSLPPRNSASLSSSTPRIEQKDDILPSLEDSNQRSMTQSTLPQELIEGIIDELGLDNEVETLKHCSLVSHAFIFQSQKYLFRAIDLDRRLPRKKYYQRFHRLIGTRPHLGAHVRELRLGDNGEDDFDGTGADVSWITSTKTLPHTLQLFLASNLFLSASIQSSRHGRASQPTCEAPSVAFSVYPPFIASPSSSLLRSRHNYSCHLGRCARLAFHVSKSIPWPHYPSTQSI